MVCQGAADLRNRICLFCNITSSPFTAFKMNKKKKKIILPLLHTLKSLKPEQRIIVLAHLNDETKDVLYQTIMWVLRGDKLPPGSRKYLQKKLLPFKKDLRYLGTAEKSPRVKQKKLMQVGGGPLKHVLSIAIPLLLDTFRP